MHSFVSIGADVVISMKIQVTLVGKMNDFARRPIAHTCGCLLELPTYPSYVEFSEEMASVLKSDVWVMDIV